MTLDHIAAARTGRRSLGQVAAEAALVAPSRLDDTLTEALHLPLFGYRDAPGGRGRAGTNIVPQEPNTRPALDFATRGLPRRGRAPGTPFHA